jgi:hypothetical protein
VKRHDIRAWHDPLVTVPIFLTCWVLPDTVLATSSKFMLAALCLEAVQKVLRRLPVGGMSSFTSAHNCWARQANSCWVPRAQWLPRARGAGCLRGACQTLPARTF